MPSSGVIANLLTIQSETVLQRLDEWDRATTRPLSFHSDGDCDAPQLVLDVALKTIFENGYELPTVARLTLDVIGVVIDPDRSDRAFVTDGLRFQPPPSRTDIKAAVLGMINSISPDTQIHFNNDRTDCVLETTSIGGLALVHGSGQPQFQANLELGLFVSQKELRRALNTVELTEAESETAGDQALLTENVYSQQVSSPPQLLEENDADDEHEYLTETEFASLSHAEWGPNLGASAENPTGLEYVLDDGWVVNRTEAANRERRVLSEGSGNLSPAEVASGSLHAADRAHDHLNTSEGGTDDEDDNESSEYAAEPEFGSGQDQLSEMVARFQRVFDTRLDDLDSRLDDLDTDMSNLERSVGS